MSFGAHPIVEARVAAAGAGGGATLPYPHLLQDFLRLPLPGKENHFSAIDGNHVQTAPEAPCDSLRLQRLPEAPKSQVLSALGDAAGPWQLERGVSQAIDEQADGSVLHLQEHRVPLAVAHKP